MITQKFFSLRVFERRLCRWMDALPLLTKLVAQSVPFTFKKSLETMRATFTSLRSILEVNIPSNGPFSPNDLSSLTLYLLQAEIAQKHKEFSATSNIYTQAFQKLI